MTIRETAARIGAEIIQDDFEDVNLRGAYTSDLLSDVLAHATEGDALLTIQAHKNTVAAAVLKHIPVIIICNSRPIPQDMEDAARDHHIALLRAGKNQFTLSGELYDLLYRAGEPPHFSQ
ncbi:MAG: hypothetical protein LBP71_07860 [Spirochaetaceae bacterium]|jgi:hypothetical protein|nr:hypothetical protein [Spirochaetaceae bacterium]